MPHLGLPLQLEHPPRAKKGKLYPSLSPALCLSPQAKHLSV